MEYFRLPEQPAPMETGRKMSEQSNVKAHAVKAEGSQTISLLEFISRRLMCDSTSGSRDGSYPKNMTHTGLFVLREIQRSSESD